MPKFAIFKYLHFFVYSYDALNEPPHVHVGLGKGNLDNTAKIWLENVEVARKGNLKAHDLKEATKFVKDYQAELIEMFQRLKDGKKISTIHVK